MLYKSLIITLITLILIVIGYLDYSYYTSFYHFLLSIGIAVISFIGYIINNKVSNMLKIYIRWLGI
jgi:hypothetical protein